MKYYGIIEHSFFEDEIIIQLISTDFSSLDSANGTIYVSDDVKFIRTYYDYDNLDSFYKSWKPYDGAVKTTGFIYQDKFYSEDEVACLEVEGSDLADAIYEANKWVAKIEIYKLGELINTSFLEL